MTKVAVIILNYNTSSNCCKCVSFLKRQQEVKLEIIIVDNCSQADDCNKVKILCQKQGYTFIPTTENRGYNAGNNIGLRYAASKDYEYALIANPDMEFPQTDYLHKMVKVLEKDEDVVIVGSDIVNPEGRHENPMKRDDWRESWGWMRSFFRKNHISLDGNSETLSGYCAKVSGCCFMVRIDFVRLIGYFDDHVFLFCEEAILSRQVEALDKKIFYLAEAKAIHRHIKSEKGNPMKRFKYWRDSRIYFIEHYSKSVFWGELLEKVVINFYIGSYVINKKIKRLFLMY